MGAILNYVEASDSYPPRLCRSLHSIPSHCRFSLPMPIRTRNKGVTQILLIIHIKLCLHYIIRLKCITVFMSKITAYSSSKNIIRNRTNRYLTQDCQQTFPFLKYGYPRSATRRGRGPYSFDYKSSSPLDLKFFSVFITI